MWGMDTATHLPLYDRSHFHAAASGTEFYHKDHTFICLVQLKNGRWLMSTPNFSGISNSFEHAAYRALNAHNLLPPNSICPPNEPDPSLH